MTTILQAIEASGRWYALPMRSQTKIFIDRAVGLPAVWLLRWPTKLLGWALRRDHGFAPERTQRIVVAKFLGMGSILQATPMLAAIRHRYPDAEIVFITAQTNAPMVERLDDIDAVLTIDDTGVFGVIASTLKVLLRLAGKVDHYFDLEVYAAYGALLGVAMRARNRIGFCRYSADFKRNIYTHLVYMNTQMPIREAYGQLARVAGCRDVSADTLAAPRVEAEDVVAIRRKLDLGTNRYLIVNPNASEMLLERRWPMHRFADLLTRLAAEEHRVVLIGAPGEAAYVQQLMRRLSDEARKRVIDSSGKLKLSELFALLRDAACVITNDTGPMHMAVALRTPTVCLFGPVNPGHYGLASERVAILYRRVYCSPCAHEISRPPCHGQNVCMQRITVEDVVGATHRLLDGGLPADHAPPRASRDSKDITDVTGVDAVPLAMLDDDGRPLGMIHPSSVLEPGDGPCPGCRDERARLRFSDMGYGWFVCATCGTVRLAPQPSDEVLSAIYGEHYYDAWGLDGTSGAGDASPSRSSTADMKRAYFRRALQREQLPAGAKVLDCGAATGFFMDVAREASLDPYGAEYSAFGAASIAERFGRDHVYEGPFENASFAALGDHSFDAVFMFDFIEHVRDPAEAISCARRLLKPGGKLVIATPDAGGLGWRLMGRRWIHTKLEHLHLFTREGMRSLLDREGFQVQHVGPVTKVLTLHYIASQFELYPHWLLTPASRLLNSLAMSLRHKQVALSIGEFTMTAMARRSSGLA